MPIDLSAVQVRLRRRTALLGAALVAPFAIVDLVQGPSPFTTIAFAARVAWVLSLLAGAALLSAAVPRVRTSALIMSGGTAATVVVIVAATGGTQSGYFAFLLAMPFCMMVLLPGHLVAAVAIGGVAAGACALMLAAAGAPFLEVVRCTGTVVASTGLAAYASRVGGEIIAHDLEAARTRAEALEALAASERRRAAVERLATVGRLAAGVAHEIKNPLCSASANLAYARERLDTVPALARERSAVESSLSDAMLAIERIHRIVADLRSFAREDPDEPCSTAVAQGVDEALRLASCRTRRIVVQAAVPGDLPDVRISRKRLVQVLLNLIVNASDAVEAASTADQARRWIAVSALRQGEDVFVSVADGGPGIAPDVLPHLFEPFFTTKPASSGMGLGLALSREYVTAAGGDLTGGNGVGGGAVFEVRLPIVVEAPARAAGQEALALSRAPVPCPRTA